MIFGKLRSGTVSAAGLSQKTTNRLITAGTTSSISGTVAGTPIGNLAQGEIKQDTAKTCVLGRCF